MAIAERRGVNHVKCRGNWGSRASPNGCPPAEARPRAKEPKINQLFRTVMKYEASDLHLKVGLPPMMRLKGVIRRMEAPPISEEQMERLLL